MPDAPVPAPDAPPADAGDPATVQMTAMVLLDAIEGGLPGNATKITLDLTAPEPSITVECADGDPITVALAPDEIARRILDVEGEDVAEDTADAEAA